MEILLFVIGLIFAYLLGSIPSAVWIGKALFGKDVREHGSGNPGATNTFRVLGKKAGVIVMLSDIIKGLLATTLVGFMMQSGYYPETNVILYKLIFGVTAVIGHIFPLFLNFKGGKGVATLLGMMVGIHWEIALICVVVFVVTLLITKYVSLSSIIATLSFPSMLLLLPRFQSTEPVLILFGFFLFVVVLWTHHKNIKRLLTGNENKSYLIKRKK